MPLYEHVFMARPDVSSSQVEALTKEYSDVITEGGGKISKSEYWGLKSLAYKIKKNRKAHYTLMNLDAPSAAVAEMERRMGLSTDIIRFITIKVAAHETEPSAMMRKSDRDERGDRGDRGGFRGGGGFRGDRGGFRGGGGGGGYRGDREGGGDRRPRSSEGGGGSGSERSAPRGGEGSTFRARPPSAPRSEPEGGEAARGPRAPRAPRDTTPSGESES